MKRILYPFVMAGVLSTAACGGDDPVARPVPTSPASTEATGSAAPDTSAAPVTTGVPSAGGGCDVQITGDVTSSFSSPSGFSAIGYGPWIPNGGTVLGVPADETFFIMNCSGPDGILLTFGTGTAADGTTAALPMAPGTYTLPKATNLFGGSEVPTVLSAATFLPGEFSWGLAEDGTFVITKFDNTGIAGSFSMTITELKSAIVTDGLPSKVATVTGTFDMANPNL